jgi:hypothetical protein
MGVARDHRLSGGRWVAARGGLRRRGYKGGRRGVSQSAQEKLLGGEMGVVGNGGGGEQCASSIFGLEEVGETDVGWWRKVVPFYI